jgi:hypothetical protein
MDPKTDVQNCLNSCQDGAMKLRSLAQTESSQTCKHLLEDAAHHLDVAVAECTYTLQKL